MTNTKKPRQRLTEGDVRGHLIRLMLPMCLGIAATMANGLIDIYWLGRYSIEAQAAVGFAFPVTMAVFSIAIGLGSGAVSVVSRAAGRGDHERVKRLATDALLLSFLIIGVISILGILTIRPLFTLMQAGPAILGPIGDYMGIWYIGILFLVAPLIANNLLRALGDAILPSLIMIGAAVINLILDPFLIFGWGPFPRLGVEGAALATVIANAATAIVVFVLLIFRERIIAFSLPPLPVLLRHWAEVARIGAMASVSSMINPVALAIITAAIASFGKESVAGFAAAGRAEAFAIIPLFALSASMGPLTGQNGGAGKTERVRETFRQGFLICFVWSFGAALVLAIAAPVIAHVMTPDPVARETARLYLWILPVTIVGYGLVIAAAAGLNGLGRPAPGMVLSLVRALGLYAPAAWIGATLAGLMGALIAMGAANLVSGVLTWVWVMRRSSMTARG